MPISTPLLSLTDIYRHFPAGEESITVLHGVSLSIQAGEMVAIMGASGSGKSTLMNLLGCLDHPSSGCYKIAGQSTNKMDSDALAKLRREHFGFIFQRYHLLPHLTALDNVAMPAVYLGENHEIRHAKATALLTRLGLADKLQARPNQLSGGQQQRVSIARALMNGGEIILADEPTGALDSQSGAEVMKILKELHHAGHTIIIVTHDPNIAAQAERIIEIKDGQILRDRPTPDQAKTGALTRSTPSITRTAWLGRFAEAFKMALLAMNANRLRTALTMLGIIIGITSVISIIAVGNGARNYVLDQIRDIGTSTIHIFPGKDWADDKAASIRTLLPGDLTALSQEPYVDSVTPESRTAIRLRYRQTDVNATINAVAASYFRVYGLQINDGRAFDNDDVRHQRQVVVIDSNTAKKLFPHKPAIGEVILAGNLSMTVIGVTKPKKSMFDSEATLKIWVPYTTAASRIFGQPYFGSITVRIKESQPTKLAEKAIAALLTQRHGGKDFFTDNLDEIVKKVESTGQTLTLLLSMIAVISLIVGGIGVMNIMLVSVTERTREIGIRMAVGARQTDVLQQFLTEAVLVCLVGGAVGVALSLGVIELVGLYAPQWQLSLSLDAILLAFICSSGIGLLFGYLPARRAARLNPIDALARE